MSRPTLAVALALAVSVPTAPLADDWDDGRPDEGYDVSVDLNVQGGVTFDTFHGPLQPYGDWVVVGSYGRVWRPRVVAGWRPYYYGRWEWTNEGWFWASDEPWGWAAYHYGRWAYDPYYGWIWVPGYEWAPAWVSWRSSGDAVGWAPLAPGYSVYVSSFPFIDFWWTFVPCNRFVSVPVYSIAYAPVHARRWYDSTAPSPAYAPRPGAPVRGERHAPAWGGPAPRLVEQRMGRPLAPARLVRAPSPGERGRPGEIPVFRPERPVRDDRRAGPVRDDRGAPGPGVGRGGGWSPGEGGNRGGNRPPPPASGVWRPEHRGGNPGAGGGAPPAPPPSGGARPERRGGDQGHGGGAPPGPPPSRGEHRGGWSPGGGGDGGGGGWNPGGGGSRGGDRGDRGDRGGGRSRSDRQ